MNEKRTSIFENGLIWFGAGVSLAEILTGTYFAPLGFGKGVLAIIIGHIIGCMMLFLAGVIGGKTRRSAMETVKMSFGEKGGIFFSFLKSMPQQGQKVYCCEIRRWISNSVVMLIAEAINGYSVELCTIFYALPT